MNAEFADYWKRLRQKLPMILLISVGAALIGFSIARNIDPTHEVHFSYLVSLSEREMADEFQFDGYYALSATDLFTATVSKWIETPEVIVAAYAEAGLPVPTNNSRQLQRSVRAEKTAPQLVEVVVQGDSREKAEILAAGLRGVMEENVEAYHSQGVPAAQFSVVATKPWSAMSSVSVPVITLAVFGFTLFAMINAVLLIEAFK